MRIGWVGFHLEGLLALRALLEHGHCVQAVFTLRPDLAKKKSGAADYSSVCDEFGVPLHFIANINDETSSALLNELSFDIVFVLGWTQIVRPETLRLARVGMIGAHASLLPRNRGRAPINWSLIRGEAETGNTLIWLAEGVDSGDIIDQITIPITPYDTCASLYDKVAESNRDMILRALPRLEAGERPGCPQSDTHEPNLPGRKPEDGLLDWSLKNFEVYDFIRGLTRPYPGAFSCLDGQRWIIWKSALIPLTCSSSAVPGQLVGPVFSPEDRSCGQVIACGRGVIVALEMENEGGEVLSGRQLSGQAWEGKVLGND